jgi:DNA-binding SARP family transcriptional activator
MVSVNRAEALLGLGRLDRYLASDRSHARLDPAAVSIDIVEFERLARAALDAVRRGSADAVPMLQAAASLRPAPFLADEGADDWADDTRGELLRLALEVRRTLAARLVEAGETEQAVGWMMAVIADDPYDEPTHHELIRVLADARRHGEARRAHRAYTARMAEREVETAPFDLIVG